jgi:hypothetical protein
MTHFVPRRETNNTTTTKREKEEVITARVSFPSVPLERKWWCEYSSLSLNENARFFREIYFFSSFSHPQKREFLEKKKKEKKKKEKKGEEQQFFSRREKKTREKDTKKKKKPLINFAPTPGTCTRKQMKEGTERENGVNAGDACVRF